MNSHWAHHALGFDTHEDEAQLLQQLWQTMHHEPPVALSLHYESSCKETYKRLPERFFELLRADGLAEGLRRFDEFSIPPCDYRTAVGGGEESEEETDFDFQDTDDEQCGRDACFDADGTYPTMSAGDRAELHQVLHEMRRRPREEHDQRAERTTVKIHVYEAAQTEVAGVVAFYKRCRLFGNLNEKYFAHLVEERTENRELAFEAVVDRFLAYQANADAYQTGSVAADAIQSELEMHAKTPRAWSNLFWQCGLKPLRIEHKGSGVRRTVSLYGSFSDPLPKNPGNIADENIEEASHQSMCGITADYMSLCVQFAFLGQEADAAAAAASMRCVRDFIRCRNARLFVGSVSIKIL